MGDIGTFLFSRPSFLRGFGSAFDLLGGGSPDYNRSPSGKAADANAILADWLQVADDLNGSVREYGQSATEEVSAR